MVRYKNRYVVFEVCPHGQSCEATFLLKSRVLHSSIIKKVEQLHGDFGVAAVRAGFVVKYCNEQTRVAVLRARHGPHRLVASCLPLVTHLNSQPVSFRILYTGATLQHCFKFLQKYQLTFLHNMYSCLKTDKDKEEMKKVLLDLNIFKRINH